MTTATTLPRLMLHHAASRGGRAAMREKRHGIWQTTSWSQHATMVLRLAAGLAVRGFGRGDTLAVIGENRPRLYASLLAAQCLGGVGVPLWPDAELRIWIARGVTACQRIRGCCPATTSKWEAYLRCEINYLASHV